MFYPYRTYGFHSPFYNPYFGYGGFGGYGGGYGGFSSGINTIGSQFSSQSLVNTGTYTGSTQTQSPTNIWG